MPPSETASLATGMLGRAAGNMKDPAARAAALDKAALGGLPAYYLKQVHGVDIVRVGPATPVEPLPQADGLITDVPGRVLCVFVADCLPIFISDKRGTAVGVFHAGWRGVAAGMPREAVAAFQRFYGIEAKNLEARIGAHIGGCCYKVGPELEARFRPESFRRTEDGLFLDVAADAAAQLAESGVPKNSIEVDDACTSCDNGDWFSFRREKHDCRNMAYAALRPVS